MKDIIIGLSLLWLLPWSIFVTQWIVDKEINDANDKELKKK